MMYRLLQDLVGWKCNFYIRCKLWCAIVSVIFLLASLQSSNSSQTGRSERTFEHGLFRHDDRPFPPPRGGEGLGGSPTENIVPPVPPTDNRDRYTYDRFKRSVTTLNFHPKAKNESASADDLAAKKPLRVFKYITEDDLVKPSSNAERHSSTIFHSLDSGADSDSSPPQRIMGGAKINLKVKLEKSGTDHNNNGGINNTINNTSTQLISIEGTANSDSSAGSKAAQSKLSSSSAQKPENILIFKPTLAIRKRSNNTSLIPSGNHHPPQTTKFSNNNNNGNSVASSNGGGGGGVTTTHESSTDPNSSTVNDRSLIHNLLFDSVVMLSEEGQKQLLHQQHQTVEEAHRETTARSSSGGSGSDEEINKYTSAKENPSASTFTSSSSSSLESTSNATISKKSPIISSSLPTTNKFDVGKEGGGGSNFTTSMATRFVESLMHQINETIGGNKDGVMIKVVKTKSKKGKGSKKPRLLDVDDVGQDGSERSRRSPFRIPINIHQSNAQRRNQGAPPSSKGGQLARAALFRRVNMPRVRHSNMGHTKVKPRLMSVPIPGKPFIARTILPMRPMPMIPQPSKLTMIPGPVGPGPVGPTIAAIKVTNLNRLNNNNKNIGLLTPVPGQDLKAAASRTVYSFKPLPTDILLNQESSYYSPTYKRFKSRFHNQISSIMDSQRDLDEPMGRRESESRFPSRSDHPKHRSRSSSRRNRPHIDRERDRERDRELDREMDRERDRERERERDRDLRERDRDLRERDRDLRERERHISDRHALDRHSRDRQPPTERHDRHDRHREKPHSRHHSHRHSPRSKKVQSPKYTYPKNAENIQDILKYFDKAAPPFGPGPRPSDHVSKTGSAFQKRQPSTLPERPGGPGGPSRPGGGPSPSRPSSHPKLADLSGEFRDVHASLLKDIKEFAKRPNLFGGGGGGGGDEGFGGGLGGGGIGFGGGGGGGGGTEVKSHPHNPFDSFEGTSIDPFDDIFNPKPKPVRDMIKPDLYSLENIRERIALKRGKLHGRYRDKDHNLDRDRGEDLKDPHHNNDHIDDEDFYDSRHRPGDDGHSTEQHVKTFSKEEYDEPQYTKKSKLKDDPHTIFPSSHYHKEKDRDRDHSSPFGYQSSEFPKETPFTVNKPVVLKRPSESYRDRVREAEAKKKPDQDFFWNTFTAGFEKPGGARTYDAPLVIKSPNPTRTHHQHPHHAAYNPYVNAYGGKHDDDDEDIVEIHTGGGPSGAASGYPSADQQMKQDRLKKLYMDVLHQKLQLEAALLRPGSVLPGMQNPSIHAQQSSLPQHSPLQLPLQMPQHSPLQLTHNHNPHPNHQVIRMPSQLSGYPPSTSVNSQIGFPRRKKPMRMKIHIYPNGHDGIEQGIEAANLLAAGGFGTSGFSASNPPGVVAVPPKEPNTNKMPDSAMPSGPQQMQGSPTGYAQHQHPHHQGSSGPGPMSGPVQQKNKNVVLHLHVHRRNDDMMSPLELEAEGSNPHEVTAKPLTYKEIFDEQVKSEQQERQDMNGSHHRSSSNHRDEEEPLLLNSAQLDTREREEPQDDDEETERERDKSVSMEVPIHDEKIEDVLHSIMKLRKKHQQQPDNRKKRS